MCIVGTDEGFIVSKASRARKDKKSPRYTKRQTATSQNQNQAESMQVYILTQNAGQHRGAESVRTTKRCPCHVLAKYSQTDQLPDESHLPTRERINQPNQPKHSKITSLAGVYNVQVPNPEESRMRPTNQKSAGQSNRRWYSEK